MASMGDIVLYETADGTGTTRPAIVTAVVSATVMHLRVFSPASEDYTKLSVPEDNSSPFAPNTWRPVPAPPPAIAGLAIPINEVRRAPPAAVRGSLLAHGPGMATTTGSDSPEEPEVDRAE